jgi:simple sugar transport system ATP-binding protein
MTESMTTQNDVSTPVIEMRHIVKQFGDFKANDDINLDVRKGEIHALLGENGAGKSTLMNILTGLLQPTSGDILINGEAVTVDSPTKAAQLGIGMVHQHFMLIDAFSVTENIILGSEVTKGMALDTKKAAAQIQSLSESYGLQVDPNAKVADISVGQQQRVEILKTLYRGADILIFDEPTAVLTPQEIEELIQIMRSLANEGKSIILITHKLDEIRAAADRVTVIRSGKSIETFPVEGVSSQQLADLMVGREVSFKTQKADAQVGEAILTIDQLTVADSRGVNAVDGLSLEVKAGEIVGLAGIDGNGQTELIQAITGLTPVKSGKVTLNGADITNKKPRQITESGVGHVPEDRHRFGMQLEMTLAENMALQTYYKAPLSKNGVMDAKAIDDLANQLVEEFDVRSAGIHVNGGSLSGGNQQKAVIARELNRANDLVIAAQPTRGLDVGAIEYIHKRLIEQRSNGKAVLVVSFELDEILNLSDRIAVINSGQIVGIVDAKATNKQELGLLMTGMSVEEARAAIAAGEAPAVPEGIEEVVKF